MKRKVILFSSIAVVIIIVLLILLKPRKNGKDGVRYETAVVQTGNINNSVSATGTIEAITTVAVGTQVSGVIQKLYVDYNSHVKKGQLLAELDKTSLTASLNEAVATLDNAKAVLAYQEANYNRLKPLYDKNLVSQADFDQVVYNYTTAKATLKTAQSQYERARINLNYATIYSPIDGVVLSRAVNEGQTVAASFSTPELFSIANDLTQMQVEVNVDEADIGQVRNNERATFTVDAYPDLQFTGEVTQVRLEPTTSNNVVTYAVIIKAPNPGQKLMPGMTATVTIITGEANNVPVVPIKALHFTPSLEQSMAKNGTSNGNSSNHSMVAQPKGYQGDSLGMAAGVIDDTEADNIASVWIKAGDSIQVRKIIVGIDDDINVQVISGLHQGDSVVVAEASNVKASGKTTSARSPFMPTPPSEQKKKSN